MSGSAVAEQLHRNPVGCRHFEPNVFRRERCKHCGHPWQLHAGAISDHDARAAAGLRQRVDRDRERAQEANRARARAVTAQQRSRRRGIEDEWFFGDAPAQDSGSDGGNDSDDVGFRMFSGRDLDRAPIERISASSSSAPRPLKVINLVDFGECNHLGGFVGGASDGASGSARSSSAALCPPPPAGAEPPLPRMPPPASATAVFSPTAESQPRLEEEIQYLRQRLKDSDEERSICVAIVRDEVADKQRAIDELRCRNEDVEASLRTLRRELDNFRSERTPTIMASPVHTPAGSTTCAVRSTSASCSTTASSAAADLEAMGRLLERGRSEMEARATEIRTYQKLERELRSECQAAETRARHLSDLVGSLRRDARDMERQNESLRNRIGEHEVAFGHVQERLWRKEVPQEAASAVTSEVELLEWQQELTEGMRTALSRLQERQLQLRLEARMQEARDGALCKICYDRPAACALLPCRHHAFCPLCAERLRRSRDPLCPLCRVKVTGVFETFVG